MTGNQIAYASLRETKRHNLANEGIAKDEYRERQRHNVNSEIAQNRSIDVQANYYSKKIDLSKAANNLREWQINNQLEIDRHKLQLQSGDMTRRQLVDNAKLELQRNELQLKAGHELNMVANNLLNAFSLTRGQTYNNYKGGNIHGQKQEKKIDPKEIERRLFK